MRKTINPRFLYPESDGKPMADNTVQFEWISTIKGNLEAQYLDDPNVFVAGDLFWYPVEGHKEIVQAPDTLVAFGRPKGDRGSYRQWDEGNIAPQVVWEIMSPNNTVAEMLKKFDFYERYGVEEYYIYDPDRGHLNGWIRENGVLKPIADMNGWVSPRLGIRFEITGGEMRLFHPDGRLFLTFAQHATEAVKAENERKFAEWERDKARQERRDQAEEQKIAANDAVEKLRAQLRAMGIEPKD